MSTTVKPQATKKGKPATKATYIIDAKVPVTDKLIVAEQLVSYYCK